MISRIENMLTDTVNFAVVDGINNSGDPTFGAMCTIKARVESNNNLQVDPAGNVKEFTHKIDSVTEIPAGARVWLQEDDTTDLGAGRRVGSVMSAKTPQGFAIFEASLEAS